MEILISAVLSELTSRSLSFFISNSSKPSALEVEDRLRRVLLRAEVIIHEAMGRHITNQAMLVQLHMLSNAIHQGYYAADIFGYQSHDQENTKDQVVTHSFPPFINFLKGFRFSSRNTETFRQLKDAFDNLSSMTTDVKELVMFLTRCPRLYRQPYSMHILLGNSMFGRQMEVELVINFLLNTQPHGAEQLEVLPIVGAVKVGKSTLVAHVCKNIRVRDQFSEILFLHDRDFTEDGLATFREGRERKHQNSVSNSNKDGRLLIVIELVDDPNEDAWNRVYSALKCCVSRGCKIIITSRSDKIVKFGTTKALTLKSLSDEAYWYFFRTLAFGTMDVETHPRLTYLAMEIVKMLNGSIIAANIGARLLRENFDTHFWYKVLVFLRGHVQEHMSRFGKHPFNIEPYTAHLGRMAAPSENFLVYHRYHCSSEDEVPKIRLKDVIYGNVRPHGKFEVLAWSSPIPPYFSYVYACEIPELKSTAIKRKRSMASDAKHTY